MSRNFLSEIVARKREATAALRGGESEARLQARAIELRKDAEPHRLLKALQAATPRVKIIAEFKRKSPSAGLLRSDPSPQEFARAYQRGGACAISVLTEEQFFNGSLSDLAAIRQATRLPILQKDFIIDATQIYKAAVARADAVLLIAAALDDDSLGQLRRIAEDELGLDALIEAHTKEELTRAINAGARLIGINNRDLRTLEVSCATGEALVAHIPAGCMRVSESGLHDAGSLRRLQQLGFDAFLIGTALMRAHDPEAALRALINDATVKPNLAQRRS